MGSPDPAKSASRRRATRIDDQTARFDPFRQFRRKFIDAFHPARGITAAHLLRLIETPRDRRDRRLSRVRSVEKLRADKRDRALVHACVSFSLFVLEYD